MIPQRSAVLFYKRLIKLGGAEVLLAEQYNYLRARGFAARIVCFEHADVQRIEIDPADTIVVPGGCTAVQTLRLALLLRRLNAQQVFCHSGHVEFGVAARLAGVTYSVFLHQPTTMSYNETDKYARRFFPRYKQFARKDRMFEEIAETYKSMPLSRRVYVNARSYVSQWGLRGARNLFVLSAYAVREKKEIFGLTARDLCGAIPTARVEALGAKSEVPPQRGKAILVSVSRLDENKRIDLLIEAIAHLRQRGEDVELLLGGTGPAKADLEACAGRLNLTHRVHFLGYVPEADIGPLYELMDLFVTIDWADFRITTYEALAENRRVVVSDDTDIDARLLESGYVFVAPPDAEKLADVIETALGTHVTWERERLAHYLQDLTWSAYFAKIDQVVTENA